MNNETMDRLAEQLAERMRDQFPGDPLGAAIRLRKSAQRGSQLGEAAGRAELLLRSGHTKDEDCFLDNPDGPPGSCVECGVYHGDPCPGCGGSGFHADDCEEMKR